MADEYWASQSPEHVFAALMGSFRELAAVEDTLADGLGFDRSDGGEDDPNGGGFVTGDHTPASLALAACAELKRLRVSRQAWAEEAMRLDMIGETLLTAVSKYDERLRFVAARYLADGSGANFRSTRCTGHSSDALAWFAVGMRSEPEPKDCPLDPSDLAACERTYEMAPEFLRELMAPVLARYRAAVAKSYPEVSSSVLPDGEAQ